MIDFTFEIKNIEGVQEALDKLADVPGWGTAIMSDWGDETSKKLKEKAYPPKPSGSTYVRTGRLKRSWKSRETGELEVTISNDASHKGKFYAPFVVGTNQAWMHKGRWWKGYETIEQEHLGTLVENLEEAAGGIWDE